MANPTKRRRRLWDAYAFSGFRPRPTVRSVFGDPEACVITLERRSKKQFAAVVVVFSPSGKQWPRSFEQQNPIYKWSL